MKDLEVLEKKLTISPVGMERSLQHGVKSPSKC